jgi:DNA-binding beta-propeller fold protein YncE
MTMPRSKTKYWLLQISLLFAATVLTVAAPAGTRIEKEGIRLDVEFKSEGGSNTPLRQGDTALIRIKLNSAANDQPIRYQQPGAWLDFSDSALGGGSCPERIAGYLREGISSKPLADLNSYLVMLLNEDNTVAVVDPNTRFDGKTNLFGLIPLAGRGFDWVKGANDGKLFVSVPEASTVDIIDGETLKLDRHLKLSANPGRLAMPPDHRLLWVGHDGRQGQQSGASVIDAVKLKNLAFIPLASGHHEFAFSADSGRVLITSRDDGSAALVDARTFKTLKTIPNLGTPISAIYSEATKSFYVADALGGRLITVAQDGGTDNSAVELKAGLGPMAISPDGRWLMAVNPVANVLHAVDLSDRRPKHAIALPGRPYQLEMSDRYAYVRSLDNEQLAMVQLASLASDNPIVQTVAMGAKAPGTTPNLPIASGLAAATSEGALFVTSPSDNAVYYYMEGMNAPASTLQASGHQVRAVTTLNRGLKETAPGVYTARVKLPAAGQLQLAVALDSPPLSHCFPLAVAAPEKSNAPPQPQLEWPSFPASQGARVKLIDGASQQVLSQLKDVRFHAMEVGGSNRLEFAAKPLGQGLYGSPWPAGLSGSYYLHVAVPSLGVKPGDLPYRSVSIPSPKH